MVMSDDDGSSQTMILVGDLVRLQSMPVSHPKRTGKGETHGKSSQGPFDHSC